MTFEGESMRRDRAVIRSTYLARIEGVRGRLRDTFRLVKRAVRTIFGTDHLLRCDISIPKSRLGSDYGGWTVCLDLLKRDPTIIYSVGLGHDISFDLALAAEITCEIFGFDPTPKTRAWLTTHPLPACFHYVPVGLADRDGLLEFGLPSDPSFDDFSLVRKDKAEFVLCEVQRLSSLAAKLRHTRIDLLKMDIEGAEYQVIDDLCSGSLLPAQLLIEFHHRINDAHIRDTLRSIAKLRDAGYLLFAISPSGRELSFVHVDALESLTKGPQIKDTGQQSAH